MTQEHKKAIIEFSKMVYPIDKYSGIYNGAGRMDLVNHLEKAFSSPDLLDKLGLQVIPQKSGEIPQDSTKSNWIKIEEGCEMPEVGKRVLCSVCCYLDDASDFRDDVNEEIILFPYQWHPLPPKP